MIERERDRGLDAAIHLERITDGFVGYDREWRVTYVNRPGEAYFGLRARRCSGA